MFLKDLANPGEIFDMFFFFYRTTAEAWFLAEAPKTKRDRVAELHYITRGAQNVEDANFEVS